MELRVRVQKIEQNPDQGGNPGQLVVTVEIRPREMSKPGLSLVMSLLIPQGAGDPSGLVDEARKQLQDFSCALAKALEVPLHF